MDQRKPIPVTVDTNNSVSNIHSDAISNFQQIWFHVHYTAAGSQGDL